MSRWKIAAAATVFAALLSVNAMAQDTTEPAAEPVATEAPAAEAVATETPAPDATAPAAEAEATPAAEAAVEAPGRIIFFRPNRLTGGAWAYTVAEVEEDGHVNDDDPRVGRLPNGRYFSLEVAPGIHNYNLTGPMAVNLAEDRIRLEVEPGETYYIEQTVRIGLITGGFRLVPSTQQEFESRRLRESVPRAND